MKRYFISLLATLAVVANAQEFDPFAQNAEAPSATTIEGSLLKSRLELTYRGNYIPDLLHEKGIDQRQDTAFADASLTYANEGSRLGARGLLVTDRVELGEQAATENDEKILEAYYEYTHSANGWYLSAGRKNLGWSSGFQWRPADLIDNGYTTKSVDMLDPRRYTGVDQVQAGILGTTLDWAFIASDQEEEKYRGKQYATKISYRGAATYSLLFGKNGDLSRKAGVLVDTVLPFGSTLAIEAINTHLDENLLMSPEYFGRSIASLSGKHNYVEVFATVTQFYDEKTRTRIEYFYNGAGFDQRNYKAEIGEGIGRYLAAGYTNPIVDTTIFANQNIHKNYIYGAYTGYWAASKLEIEPNVLVNLKDRSYLGSLSFKRAFFGNSELSVRLNWFRGDKESEYGGVSPGTGVLIGLKIKAF